jgi:hypothetical protein
MEINNILYTMTIISYCRSRRAVFPSGFGKKEEKKLNFVEQMRQTVNENKEAYPLLSQWTKAMWESPFMEQYQRDGNDHEEGREIMNVNGKPMGQAVWNLICTKRDLTLWTKIGMKPTRSWKVTTAKKYFGIKGTGENLMKQFMLIFNVIHEGHY